MYGKFYLANGTVVSVVVLHVSLECLFSAKEDDIDILGPPANTKSYCEDAMELYAIPDVAAHYEVVRTPA